MTHLDAAAGRAAASVLSAGSTVVAVGVGDRRSTLLDVVHTAEAADGSDDPPVFDIGSVTKVVATAPLCMRLDLDAPVSRWLPRTPGSVHDLLEHQAGLWEWWPLYLSGGTDPQSSLAVLSELPSRYPVGSGRHYSDLGFMLLGAIVELEYGERLDVVLDFRAAIEQLWAFRREFDDTGRAPPRPQQHGAVAVDPEQAFCDELRHGVRVYR